MQVVVHRLCAVKIGTTLALREDVILDDVPWDDRELAVEKRVESYNRNLVYAKREQLTTIKTENTYQE